MISMNDLEKAMEGADSGEASRQLNKLLAEGRDGWEIHLALYPLVQRVLNPPFINPHLPKMYAIYRELMPYLKKEEIPSLIHLEVTEYTKRPKQEKLNKTKLLKRPVKFRDVETAISEGNWEKTASLMAAFQAQAGKTELARRLLLLGSGYLDHTLGHSVSCTAFMLLEMLERGEDSWTVHASLADYFCKGGFEKTPALMKSTDLSAADDLSKQLLQATSGKGIVPLHHTITLYALERARHLLSRDEYGHMLMAWAAFMGEKEEAPFSLGMASREAPHDYTAFFNIFSRMDAPLMTATVMAMTGTAEDRHRLSRYLIKAVCESYQGNFNPHYLTGLGCTLWVIGTYGTRPEIVQNTLFQYLDFFFDGLQSPG